MPESYNQKQLQKLFELWKGLIRRRGLEDYDTPERQRLDKVYNTVLPWIVLITEANPNQDVSSLITQATNLIGEYIMRTRKEIERTITDLESQVKRLENDIEQLSCKPRRGSYQPRDRSRRLRRLILA